MLDGSSTDDDALTGNAAELERRFGFKPKDWGRNITARDIQWLLDYCPFIQVIAGGGVESTVKVKVLQAPSSNWPICHYGDAMSSSPGPYIIGGGYFRVRFNDEDDEDEDEGGSGIVNPGKGTIINQAFLTAADMVKIAIEEGWKSMHVVDCHRLMGRALWIHGQREGMIITGFDANENDQRIKRLLEISFDQFQVRRGTIHTSPGSQSGATDA